MEFSSLGVYGSAFCNNPMIEIPKPKKLDKAEQVDKVRALLKTDGANLNLPFIDDDTILRFLHARKMDSQASYQLIVNHYSYRKNNSTLFQNLTVNERDIHRCLNDGLPTVLKSRDRKGRCVIMFLLYQWNHVNYTVETLYRTLVLSMECLLEDIQNQLNGFVFIIDSTNFKFKDYIDMAPKFIRLIVDGFQDSFPAKIKGFHFIGQPWYVDGILSIIKTFVKEKTKQKLVMHGTNLSSLHEYIPRDVAPPELGGEGISYKPDEWIEKLVDYERRKYE